MHSFVHSLWLSNFKFNRWLGLFSSSHLHFFHWVRRSFPMYLMRIGWLYSANGDLLQRRHCFYKALTWCGRWHRRHQRGWSLELKRSIVSCYFFYVISTQKLFWKVTLFFRAIAWIHSAYGGCEQGPLWHCEPSPGSWGWHGRWRWGLRAIRAFHFHLNSSTRMENGGAGACNLYAWFICIRLLFGHVSTKHQTT